LEQLAKFIKTHVDVKFKFNDKGLDERWSMQEQVTMMQAQEKLAPENDLVKIAERELRR